MQWVRDYTPQPSRNQLYTRALIITLAGNVLLAGSKGIVAYISGSAAIYADAANSISDVLYSLLMVLGLYMAQRPPDLSHPQGHARFEPLVGLAVAMSMTYAGFEAARNAIERLTAGGLAVEPGLPSLVLLGSALIKLVMFLLIRKIAKEVQSPTLTVTATDNLSDVLTSVAAFVGVMGSQISHLLDPIAGLVVAAWIFRNAFNAAKENIHYLTGGGADDDLRERIVQKAASVPGVAKVHHMMTEYVGAKLAVDMHINCDGNISLNEAHSISDRVIAAVESLPEIDRAYVHIEPNGWEDSENTPAG
ncbi:MAG: cation diffusion facilitator family transporter [Anaerolineaceae bacterium]